jgi:hypothetical protein
MKNMKLMHSERNCPIREFTADGVPVGRCWFYCHDGVCERHGDVSVELKLYNETGKLTDERQRVRNT